MTVPEPGSMMLLDAERRIRFINRPAPGLTIDQTGPIPQFLL